jgi:hypothetical protein
VVAVVVGGRRGNSGGSGSGRCWGRWTVVDGGRRWWTVVDGGREVDQPWDSDPLLIEHMSCDELRVGRNDLTIIENKDEK